MMMRIDIISAVPELLTSPLNTSILKRAQNKKKVKIEIHNLRDYAFDKHKQIDDKPFGGGAGMVLKPEPLFEGIEKLKSIHKYDHIIFTTAKGKLFDQKYANKLSLAKNILIIAGHYKDIDDREAALDDSFQDGDVVEAPFYTRPAEYRGMKVPEILLSGNEKEIKKWKQEQSKILTEKWRKYNN